MPRSRPCPRGHRTPSLSLPQLFHAASVGLCTAVILAFGLPAFTFRQNLAATALLLLLFGCVRGRGLLG